MNELACVKHYIMNPKEYNGQRVVTFKDIDILHDRADGTARRNFSANKARFIEGVDYVTITPKMLENTGMYEIRTSGITKVNQRGTTFLTETGYLMLVKSFTDDLAWVVQRELVNRYFREKLQENQLSKYTTESNELRQLKIAAKDFALYYLDKLTLAGQGKALVLLQELARNEEYTKPKALIVG